MLRAILHSKDRRINIDKKHFDDETGVNFRTLYPETEDFFTSTVFERLCYLASDDLWALLQSACKDDFLPNSSGELLSREFWPSWSYKQSRVEPDLFFRFANYDLIIEAKRSDSGDSGQDAAQIKKEFDAYYQKYGTEEKLCFLLAVGGGWHGLQEKLGNLKDELNKFKAKYISWQDLFDATQNGKWGNTFFREDIKAAFELHGIQEILWLSDLTELRIKKLVSNLHYYSAIKTLKPITDIIQA